MAKAKAKKVEAEPEVAVDVVAAKVAEALDGVELDADESKAALDAALAIKLAAIEQETRDAHAEEEAAKLRDPKKFMVVEAAGGSSVQPVPEGWFRDRAIVNGKQNCEHVGEDEYGRWIYRAM